MSPVRLAPQPLTPEAFSAYGQMWGQPYSDKVAGFSNPASDFWHQHYFDAGDGGTPEVLWVNYRNTDRDIHELEVHWQTQQAIVPLGSAGIIHVVAACQANSDQPDPDTLRAFYVEPGYGISMNPGCWHTTRVVAAQVTCLMLTRGSTTIELAAHLNQKLEAQESGFAAVVAQIVTE